MSIHSSLKTAGALARTRNVFKRIERLQILAEQKRWDETKSVYGLPKVRTRFKAVAGRKKKKKEEKEKKAEEGTAAAS